MNVRGDPQAKETRQRIVKVDVTIFAIMFDFSLDEFGRMCALPCLAKALKLPAKVT